MRLEHRIVVGAEMSRDAVPVDRCIEHAAHVDARDRTAVHAEPDETRYVAKSLIPRERLQFETDR